MHTSRIGQISYFLRLGEKIGISWDADNNEFTVQDTSATLLGSNLFV